MFESLKRVFRSEKEMLGGKKISMEEYLIPKNLQGFFEVEGIREKKQEYNLKLLEKKDQMPEAAKGREGIVLNGYMNRVEYLTFPNFGLPYIQAYRPRWKDPATGEEFTNEYD